MTTFRRASLAVVLLVTLVVIVIQYKSPSFFRNLLHRKEGVAASTVKPSQQLLNQTQPVIPNHSDESVDAEIAQIDAYCKDLDAFQDAHAKEAILLASVDGDYLEKMPKPWKRFASIDAIQKFFDSNQDAPVEDSANVFERDGHVILAAVTFTDNPGAGDWLIYATYYFSGDGKLVKISSQLNTFEGDVSVFREAYFSPEGRQLREDTQFFTMEDHKKLDKPDEDFVDMPTPRFLTVNLSPFRGAESTQEILSSL